MITWPIGLSTGCFYHTSIFECLELIRSSGFSMIEVCFSPAHLDYHDLPLVHQAAARIDDLGMEACSFHAPFATGLDISSPDSKLRCQAFDEICRAVDAAAALQARYFVIHPGPEISVVPPPEERLQRMENVVEILNLVAKRCHDAGVGCLLENKLPHLLFGKTSDIMWILDALDSIEVGVCLDTGHGALARELPTLMHKFAGHMKMVHAHDNTGRDDDHLPPGDGCIYWELVLQTLAAGNFRGPLILELASAPNAETSLANARRGRSFLSKLSRRLGL